MPEHNDSNDVSEILPANHPVSSSGQRQRAATPYQRGWTGLFVTPTQNHTLCQECSQDGGSLSDIFPENSPRLQYYEP